MKAEVQPSPPIQDVASMRISVRFFTTLQEVAGTREDGVELGEGGRLLDLIETVSTKYGAVAMTYLYVRDSGRIDPSIKFLINGVAAQHLGGLETPLKDGDVVAIIPPIGGG